MFFLQILQPSMSSLPWQSDAQAMFPFSRNKFSLEIKLLLKTHKVFHWQRKGILSTRYHSKCYPAIQSWAEQWKALTHKISLLLVSEIRLTTTLGGIHQATVSTKRWNSYEEYSLFLGSVTRAEAWSLALACQRQHIPSTVNSCLVRNPSFNEQQSCRCGFHLLTWAFPLRLQHIS